ncbi:hypothetical protein [Tessaracoccus massiliensis]|uniref:hypothetical protein n=1 Tax=Tessaracoccus massiliensis TaxID=1522311 RepID=UPI0005900E4C|nr:hypothetical protein [Tessaracoccus massiliensis]
MAETTYLIQARPPVRAFAIAAVATLLGAVVLVAALSSGWHVLVAILGGMVMAAGFVLFAAAFTTMGRNAVQVTFTEDGYRVEGREVNGEGHWGDVTKVTQTQSGNRVTIQHGPDRATYLMFPGNDPKQVDDVVLDIRERLRVVKGI